MTYKIRRGRLNPFIVVKPVGSWADEIVHTSGSIAECVTWIKDQREKELQDIVDEFLEHEKEKA